MKGRLSARGLAILEALHGALLDDVKGVRLLSLRDDVLRGLVLDLLHRVRQQRDLVVLETLEKHALAQEVRVPARGGLRY